jgi:hypothetical protein
MPQDPVWIAFTDTPDAPAQILGVFATQKGASDFVDEVFGDFPDSSLLYGEYAIGWRYDEGSSRYAKVP